MTDRGAPRSRLLRWWEELAIPVQIGVTWVPLVVILWIVHVTLLAQPLGRGLIYGIFWGSLATGAVVGATRSERARRIAREQAERAAAGEPAPGARREPDGFR